MPRERVNYAARGGVAGALALLLAAAALAGCGGGKKAPTTASSAPATAATTATTGTATTSTTASVTAGASLFTARCASCHTLAAAHATGKVGPDLDYVQPTVAQTEATIASGMRGSTATMPAGLLRGQQAADVAAYLAQVAKRSNVKLANP